MARTPTRERLIAAAIELFAERGYDETPATMIAAHAGVTEMTFYRHFATKSAVLVEDPYDPLIAGAITRRPAEEQPLVAATRGIRDAWQEVPEPAAAAVRERLRIVAAAPSLLAALSRSSAATEHAIAEALRARGADPTEGRIVAAALVAALNASLLEWAVGDDPDLGTALSVVFAVFGGERG